LTRKEFSQITFGEYLEREYAFFFKHEMELHRTRFTLLANCEKGTTLKDVMSLPLYDRFLEDGSSAIIEINPIPLKDRKTASELIDEFNY
jgi:hypothetical protein